MTSIFYVQLQFGLLLVQLVGHCICSLREVAICLGGCYTTQTAICSNYKATKSTNCCKHLQVIDLEMGMATIMIQNVFNSVTFLRIAVNPYPLSFLLLQDSFQDINILCTAAIRPPPRPAPRALHLQSQGGGDLPGRVNRKCHQCIASFRPLSLFAQ